MNMYEELKAWAEKWGIDHIVCERGNLVDIEFSGPCWYNATFSYNKERNSYIWYGGD